jgi:hypothetical protein
MELKDAARELGVSSRHIHRLIRMNLIPAKKITVEQVITKQVWDIDTEAIKSAYELLLDLDNEHFGEWALKWTQRLEITPEKLAQMTKIKKKNLLLILQKPGYPKDEYYGILRKDPTMPIIEAILREYIKHKN